MIDTLLRVFVVRRTLPRATEFSARLSAMLAMLVMAAWAVSDAAAEDQADLPDAKPVPVAQVIPLPYDQASFQYLGAETAGHSHAAFPGHELTRYHFGRSLKRPFWYPLIGPAGRSLTRMGHPRDPHSHSHHNSVWISHHDVGGVNFWADGGKGQIVCRLVKQYEDGDRQAWMLTRNAWQDDQGKVLLNEWRRACVQLPHQGKVPVNVNHWLMLVDLSLEAPGNEPVTLGRTPFGMIGVRMAKTIGVHDGGGRILNSQGQVDEEQVFRKPARWVDYSGRVTRQLTGGITLMDHPANPDHPTPFHVRNDGWMGACLTLARPLTIEPGKPLRLRYGLWVHAGMSKAEQIEAQWKDFADDELPEMPSPGK